MQIILHMYVDSEMHILCFKLEYGEVDRGE